MENSFSRFLLDILHFPFQAGNARTHGHFCHSAGNSRYNTAVKRSGDNVVLAQFILRNEAGNGTNGSHLHLFRNGRGADSEGPAENTREDRRQKYQQSENLYQQEIAVIREQQTHLLHREQTEEESLEVMKNRWEDWEEKARKRLIDGEEKLQISKKELDRVSGSLQKFLQEENRKRYSDSVKL